MDSCCYMSKRTASGALREPKPKKVKKTTCSDEIELKYGPIGTIHMLYWVGDKTCKCKQPHLSYFGEVVSYNIKRGKITCNMRLLKPIKTEEHVPGVGDVITIIGPGEATGCMFDVLPSGRIRGIDSSLRYEIEGIWKNGSRVFGGVRD